MKRLLAFLSLLFAIACCGASLTAENRKSAVEIEFEYTPSWRDETLVYMARMPDGKIHCSILTRPELGERASERKWKTVKEVSISSEVFAQIESWFDSPKLRQAAERDWPPMPDGSRWRLRRKTGSLAVDIVAHNPDLSAEGAPIVQLARAISDTVGANLFPQ